MTGGTVRAILGTRRGAWRRVVARLLWEQEVASSSLAAPIREPGRRAFRRVARSGRRRRDVLPTAVIAGVIQW